MLYFAVGCFRSGTSALGCAFKENGFYCGDTIGEVPYQPVALVELQSLIDTQEQILNRNKGTWYSPKKVNKLTQQEIDTLDDILHPFTKRNSFVKSHRSLFMFEPLLRVKSLWDSMGNNSLRVFGIFRNPASVAYSFENLNAPDKQLTFKEGLKLWHRYNSYLLEYAKKYNFRLINFDDYSLYADVESITGMSLKVRESFKPKLDVDASEFGECMPVPTTHYDLWQQLKNHAVQYKGRTNE